METRRIATLEDLGEVAKDVFASCTLHETTCVIGLSGDLGAGKTAFVKELARLLKIQHEITSPTFVIMKSYSVPDHPFFKMLTHIDAYRVESDDEMRVLGFKEIVADPTRIVCIEWPEKIQNILPRDTHSVRIEIESGNTRTITYGN